jgi:hypothetical protein
MSLRDNPGRCAGVLYLLLALAAPYRLMYIPGKLFVSGNAGATAENILAHEFLFRLGLITDIFAGTMVLLLSLALYRLFKDVDQKLAVLVVLLGGILPCAIYYVNLLTDAATLIFVTGPSFLSVFSEPQRHAMAMLFLRLHHQEVLAAETLWGLWLFPLACLTYKSRYLPRFIAIWLVVNGLAYLATSWTGLLAPQYEALLANIAFPALLGEIAFMLWLVVKGARPHKEKAV